MPSDIFSGVLAVLKKMHVFMRGQLMTPAALGMESLRVLLVGKADVTVNVVITFGILPHSPLVPES